MNIVESEIKKNDSKKRYPKELEEYPSVTQILGIIAKPGLMNWFKNKPKFEIEAISEESKTIGKIIHDVIHEVLKGEKVSISTSFPEKVRSCLNSFIDWKEKHIIELIKSEEQLLHNFYGYVGTPDALCKIDGKNVLCEWKTSKAIYPEYKLQAIAYKKLCEINYNIYIDEVWILRFDKEGGVFESVKIEEDHDYIFDTFIHCLALYRWLNKK